MDEKLLTDWLYEGKYEVPLAKPMFTVNKAKSPLL